MMLLNNKNINNDMKIMAKVILLTQYIYQSIISIAIHSHYFAIYANTSFSVKLKDRDYLD